MKKILLCVSLLSMFAAGFVGCSQKREWNHEQRKAMREALRSYRQMVYLDDLTDAFIRAQIRNSYLLVLRQNVTPKSLREEILAYVGEHGLPE